MKKKQKLKYANITKKWGGKAIRSYYDSQIDVWINQFEEDERDVVLELLKHFQYYTNRKLNNCVRELYSKLCELQKFNLDNATVFIPTYKEYGVGFSDLFFNMFWTMNDLYDYSEKNIYSLLAEDKSFESIVIVDDYSGTGGTVKKTIKKCLEGNCNCEQTQFFVLVSEMSCNAKERIKRFAETNKICIEIVALKISDKAFKENYLFDENGSKVMNDRYYDVSVRYKVKEDMILGYEKTQALVAFEYNTPNNTLGLFWHEDEEFISIFKRHKKKSTTLSSMQKDASKRKKQRETNVVRRHDEKEAYVFLMIYLINKDMKFNYDEACVEFGMTTAQMDEALHYLLERKYVKIVQGHFRPTALLKEYIKITKVKSVDLVSEENILIGETEKKYVPKNFEKTFSGYKL